MLPYSLGLTGFDTLARIRQISLPGPEVVLSRRVWAGLFAGLLFALHPALVANVANLANRFDLLMTPGVCLTFLFILHAYRARGMMRVLAFGLAWASFVLARGAKEPAR